MKTKTTTVLTFKYYDHYDLPIYEDPDGKEWIDVNPREDVEPRIFEYEDGMPNDAFTKGKIEFSPERKTVPPDSVLKMTWLVI